MAFLPIYALPYWDEIGGFVTACVNRCKQQQIGRSEAAMFTACTSLVFWAWQVRGMDLTVARVFARSTIEQFVHLGMSGHLPGSRATIRSTLWRMRDNLNPDDRPTVTLPIARSAPTSPYDAAEVAALHSWATAQGTERRRTDALVLLALGLGAGLATRELLGIAGADLTFGDNNTAQVVVREGGRPRSVPLLDGWAKVLSRLGLDQDPSIWVFRPGRKSVSSGQITDFLMRARTDLDVRPARMRATWLQHHLAVGTNPWELLRISGLKNLAALDRLTVGANPFPMPDG